MPAERYFQPLLAEHDHTIGTIPLFRMSGSATACTRTPIRGMSGISCSCARTRDGVAGLIEDAAEHGSCMRIDAGIESLRLVGK
jgi:hypothetical protein